MELHSRFVARILQQLFYKKTGAAFWCDWSTDSLRTAGSVVMTLQQSSCPRTRVSAFGSRRRRILYDSSEGLSQKKEPVAVIKCDWTSVIVVIILQQSSLSRPHIPAPVHESLSSYHTLLLSNVQFVVQCRTTCQPLFSPSELYNQDLEFTNVLRGIS